ncbi:MAG: hypothetical protein KKD77_22425 [Gammaproteobacteria bacterium]|nr:hypothetical protein [Gammaproteobacteria bacterium]
MGRPKGSKNKKKTKKVKFNRIAICSLCEVYQTTQTEKRTTSGSIHARFCSKLEAYVQKNTDACNLFKLAKIISCVSDMKRVHSIVCMYKYVHKIDDCHKCFVGEMISLLEKG